MALLFCSLVFPRTALADVRLPGIFGSHMVLQQDTTIPVWGWADAGESITVTLGEQTCATVAASNGSWRVDLAPLKIAATPRTLTVTGRNSLTFDDVLVGDVWLCYGQDLVYSGPIYDALKIEGNTIRLTFRETGSGLQMGTPPWTPDGKPAPTPTDLTGFAIAGTDRKWVWAKARLEGNAVLVASDQVASPVAVRYGWASNPACNLYNKEGLPASPFRTDDWPL